MRVGFLMDRPPIFNGGFSQRIMREVGIVSNLAEIDVYMHVLSSIGNINKNVKKRIHEIYDACGIKGYTFSFLLSSKLALNKKVYDRFYIETVKQFIKKYNIDILICENLWCAYIGSVACSESEIKAVFDYHGVVPEENVFDGYCKREDKKYKYLKGIERKALINCNSIICVSNSFKRYLTSEFEIDNKKINVIPCCINEDNINYNRKIRNEIRENLEIEDRKVLIYAGSITKYQCVEEMIWIFSQLHKMDNRFYFIFLSAYTNYDLIKNIFHKKNISEDDYFIGSVSHEEVYKYNCAADFGLIIRENHILNKVASPTKIAEYLSAGLTVIGTYGIGDLDNMNIPKVLIEYSEIHEKRVEALNKIIEVEISEEKRIENYLQCKKVIEKELLWECYTNTYYLLLHELVEKEKYEANNQII